MGRVKGAYHAIKDGKKMCRACKQWISVDYFYKYPQGHLESYCDDCIGTVRSNYIKTHKEKISSLKHGNYIKNMYGITHDIYNKMLEAQDGKCAICGSRYGAVIRGKKARLSVDHDSTTGAVRGLLCGSCNRGIGQLKHSVESLEKAIIYLMAGKDYRETL